MIEAVSSGLTAWAVVPKRRGVGQRAFSPSASIFSREGLLPPAPARKETELSDFGQVLFHRGCLPQKIPVRDDYDFGI